MIDLNTALASDIITFGKYRGHPISTLIADADYCRWLMSQEWFCTRYVWVHEMIVNGGIKPEDTPEHNKLQVKFLDDKVCINAFCSTGIKVDKIIDREFEYGKSQIDVFLRGEEQYEYEFDLYDRKSGSTITKRAKSFRTHTLFVEIKPTIGDDYPSILRQVRHKKDYTGDICIVYKQFTASTVTLIQIRKIFNSIPLICIDDIES